MRENRRGTVHSEIQKYRELPKTKIVPDHLQPQVFWDEVEQYYKRFDEDQIRMMMGDCSRGELAPQEELPAVKPLHCLLSCLLPESNNPPPLCEQMVDTSQSVLLPSCSDELDRLNPFIVEELNRYGLIKNLPPNEDEEVDRLVRTWDVYEE